MTSTQSLKTQLFSSLKNQGFHDDIKKQLRAKIIEQLKEKKVIQTKSESKQLFQRVMSSLIVEELQFNEFPFTESIYEVEAGFQGAYLKRQELKSMLIIKQKDLNEDQSILQSILRKKQPFSATTLQHVQIQTNSQQVGYTLQQKLMLIDQEYRSNLLQKQTLKNSALTDRKRFQQQLMEKYKKQYELFREFQTHKIKIKVGQQWRIRFQQYSNELSEEYQRKYDQLRKKDKALNEQFILKNNQFNMKMNQSEKTIRQKIQMLDMKNLTVQTQMQNLAKSRQSFQQQVTKRQQELQQKIRQYDTLALLINEKIKYQVNLAKLALQQEYQDREAESMRRKKVIDQDYGKLMGIKDSIEIVERENQRLSKENQSLRNRLNGIQKELKQCIVQLGNKVGRIQVLKDDLATSNEERKISDQKFKQEVKKSKRYESEILSMRQELQKLRAKQNINNNQSQISQLSFETQKNPETKRIQQVSRRLERLKNERKKDIQKFKLQI